MFLAKSLLVVPFAALLVAGHRVPLHRRQDGPVDPSTIKDCTFYVTANQGDTCSSIAANWGITDAQFLEYNPSVKANCSGLKVGNSYCVEVNNGQPTTTKQTTTSPTTTAKPSPTQSGLVGNCRDFYFVKQGDGCQAIVDMYKTFTLSDFYTWNPAVKNDCSGLQANTWVCVGIPSTPTKPTTTTATTTTRGPQPQQTGIVSNCASYYLVKSGDQCQAIVDKYGTFTLQQFYNWNPAVGSSCQSLQAGYYVCVGIPSTPTTRPTTTAATGPTPTQTGIRKDCTKYYKAVSGDTCQKIVDHEGTFTLQQFVSWNPAVQSDCTKLLVGYYYCIAIPGTPTTKSTQKPTTTPSGPQPQQTGIVKNCNKFYLVKDGDQCGTIAQRNGVSLTQFFTWNTGIKKDCSNLFKGYYVCIGVS